MSAERLTAAEVVEQLRTFERRLVKECDEADDEGDSILSGVRESEAVAVAMCLEAIEDNLIETPEQSRERFERWRLSQDDTAAALARRHADGSYQDVALRLMWTTWEASRTFRSEQES